MVDGCPCQQMQHTKPFDSASALRDIFLKSPTNGEDMGIVAMNPSKDGAFAIFVAGKETKWRFDVKQVEI